MRGSFAFASSPSLLALVSSFVLGVGTLLSPTGPLARAADRASAAPADDVDRLLDAAAQYQATGSRAALLEVEKAVAASATQAGLREAMARKLAARLALPATPEGRNFLLWQLSLVGSDAQVPALAGFLDGPHAYYARLALERLPGEAASDALRQRARETTGQAQRDLVNSLGARGDSRAVPDLAEIAGGAELENSRAAIRALGQIGGPEAFVALSNLKWDRLPGEAARGSALDGERARAQLQCAARLVSEPGAADLVPVLEKLAAAGEPSVRMAAFQLLARVMKAETGPRVLAALKSGDAVLRQAGLAVLQSAGDALLLSAAKELGAHAPEVDASVLEILAERRAAAALPQVTRAADSEHRSVRVAALRALGQVGGPGTVPVLLTHAGKWGAEERGAVADALARLTGEGVDEALVGELAGAWPEAQLALILALRTRGAVGAAPRLLTSATDGDLSVRREAIRAIGQLGGTDLCPAMIGMLNGAPGQIVSELESALAEICRRNNDAAPLVRALPGLTGGARVAILNALAAVGGGQAAAALQGELKSTDPEVRRAAIRLLAEWPDPAPVRALGAVAVSDSDPGSRTLALRGLARLLPLAQGAPLDEALEAVGKALPGAGANEQRALLAALGQTPRPAALKIAAAHLEHPELGADARAAAIKILEGLDPAFRSDARPVLGQLKRSASASASAQLDWLELKFGDLRNLSADATASSTDGLAQDGEGGPPAAAIDGNQKTYWDEIDSQKLYTLRVEFKQPAKVVLLRMAGWQHHNYAPRDFEILADGKPLRKIEGAQYTDNVLRLDLPGTVCRALELRITGCYGPSPAIRELEIYGTTAKE